VTQRRQLAGRFVRVDRQLRNEGYEPRTPSTEVAVQDEATCRWLVCPRCQEPGLEYRPYLQPSGRRFRYRAVAVCGRCDEALEF
jgi:hypothetical protein